MKLCFIEENIRTWSNFVIYNTRKLKSKCFLNKYQITFTERTYELKK